MEEILQNLDPVYRILQEINVPVDINSRKTIHVVHKCVILSHLEQVKKYSSQINTYDGLGNTPLHYAILLRNEEMVRVLLDIGANPNLLQHSDPQSNNNPQTFEQHNNKGYGAIHLACESYFVPILKLLLECEEIDVNLRSTRGFTPLHIACKTLFYDAVQLLLEERGINPNCLTGSMLSPLHIIALNATSNSILKYDDDSLEDFARPSFPESSTEHLLLLLKYRCHPDLVDINGCNVLHIAAKRGITSLVSVLLKATNLDIDAVDNNGNSALHHAVNYGTLCSSSPKLVIQLLKSGADALLENSFKESPLKIVRIKMKSRMWTQSEFLALQVVERHLLIRTKERAQDSRPQVEMKS